MAGPGRQQAGLPSYPWRNRDICFGKQGMALVLTLACISFLIALTLQLMATVDRHRNTALAQQERVRLDALVLGGLHFARAALLLDQQANTYDSLFDSWNTFEPSKLQALLAEEGERIQVQLVVADMGGRLQVNALGQDAFGPGLMLGAEDAGRRAAAAQERYRRLWRRFLASGRFAIGQEEIEPLLDALADWVDKDQQARPLGAEQGYYQLQEPPCNPRNAPIRFVEELLLVRGMSKELLYGDAEHEGLLPYITVAGNDAAVNINTAPLPVLLALLPGMSEENGRDILAFRSARDNREALATPAWFHQVRGLPADLGADLPLLTVQSRYFAIQVRAERDQYQRLGTGLLERRDNGGQNLLLWEIQ